MKIRISPDAIRNAPDRFRPLPSSVVRASLLAEGAAALVRVLGADDADDRHGLILHLRFDRSTEAVGHEPLASPERERRCVREAARNLGRSRRELRVGDERHTGQVPARRAEARDEARTLLEEHRKLIGQARSEAEQILAEARRTGEAMEHRMREETEAERKRRIEETRREIAAETARALEKIRTEVADLTLEATAIVVGRRLDSERDRELITEAIGSLDFSRLEDPR